MSETRETFASRFGGLMTIVGVSVGLGHVWRFPYMVGKFGGAAFVLFYTLVSVVIGVPALMAEFALGRYARRGPVGAFQRGGLPFGRYVGWFFFFVVTAATGYYSAVIGWVLYYTVGQAAMAVHVPFNAAAILPPDHGFVLESFLLQLACTAIVLLACAGVLLKGVRKGIEVRLGSSVTQVDRAADGRLTAVVAQGTQAAHETVENCRVDWVGEGNSDVGSLHPANVGFDCVESVELHPNGLLEARALDEFQLAAFRRNVVNVYEKMVVSAAAKLHFGLQADSGALPFPRTLRSGPALDILVHASTPQEVRVKYRLLTR